MIVCEEESNYCLLMDFFFHHSPHHSKTNVHSVPVHTMATSCPKLTGADVPGMAVTVVLPVCTSTTKDPGHIRLNFLPSLPVIQDPSTCPQWGSQREPGGEDKRKTGRDTLPLGLFLLLLS